MRARSEASPARRASPAQVARVTTGTLSRADSRMLTACSLIIASHVLDGPLRSALGIAHLVSLLYARDALALYVVAETLAQWWRGERRGIGLVCVLGILTWHFIVGVLVVRSAYMAALGLKVFDGFLLGFCIGPVAVRHPRLPRFALITLLVTAAGVIANSFFDFPWIGAAFDTAFGQVEGSRNWSTHGIQRLPGFARASYDASIMMLLAVASILPVRGLGVAKLLLCAIAGYAIVLTTTKAGATAVVALAAWYLFEVALEWRWAVIAEIWGLFAVCVALPVFAVFGYAILCNIEFPWWMASFADRLINTWPKAYDLVSNDGVTTRIMGRGLGGIGFPQFAVNTMDPNPADNLAVYVLAVFGVLGVVYLAGWLVALSSRSTARYPVVHGWTIVLLACGLTTNMLENSVMSIVVGIAFGFVFQPERTMKAVS